MLLRPPALPMVVLKSVSALAAVDVAVVVAAAAVVAIVVSVVAVAVVVVVAAIVVLVAAAAEVVVAVVEALGVGPDANCYVSLFTLRIRLMQAGNNENLSIGMRSLTGFQN